MSFGSHPESRGVFALSDFVPWSRVARVFVPAAATVKRRKAPQAGLQGLLWGEYVSLLLAVLALSVFGHGHGSAHGPSIAYWFHPQGTKALTFRNDPDTANSPGWSDSSMGPSRFRGNRGSAQPPSCTAQQCSCFQRGHKKSAPAGTLQESGFQCLFDPPPVV